MKISETELLQIVFAQLAAEGMPATLPNVTWRMAEIAVRAIDAMSPGYRWLKAHEWSIQKKHSLPERAVPEIA